MSRRLQRRIQDAVKHIRWSILQKKLINFRKHSILDVWHGSEYASGLLKLF